MSLCRQSGWTGSHPKKKNHIWSTGWIPLEPQEHRQQDHPYQGHGCWADLATIAPHPYNGWAYTLDATPSSYDERTQMWVFGLCVHTMTLGQMKRLGALTGVAKGEQTKARALLAGAVALAKHTTTPAKVIAQLATVWEAWHQPAAEQPFRTSLRSHRARLCPHHGALHQSSNQNSRCTGQRTTAQEASAGLCHSSLGAGQTVPRPQTGRMARNLRLRPQADLHPCCPTAGQDL